MHKSPKIPEERLQARLQDQYNLIPITLEFLPMGLDYNAGVYRVVSQQDIPYLLKATSRPLYEPRCLIPRYLNDEGITSVVAPIPTTTGTLWTHLDQWTIIIYPFIEGETTWTGMTDEQWLEVGTIFRQIHRVKLPPSGYALARRRWFRQQQSDRADPA